MALLAPKQRQFAAALSQQTGLNPRVVSSWLLAEQSGSAARFYEGKGYNNWLNIARTDSGDAGGAHSGVWSNPITAAKATAEWLAGKGQIAKEYGKPAAGIQAILHTAGHDPNSQIGAIASSGWASSGYNGGNTLRQLYGQLGGEHLPQVTTGPGAHAAMASAVMAHAAGEPAPTLPGPNAAQNADFTALLQGLATPAQQGPSIGALAPPSPNAPRTVAPIQPSGPSSDERLNGLLGIVAKLGQDAEAAPEPSAEGAPEGAVPHTQVAGEHPGHYVNPLPGFTKGRTDQGVDYSSHPGAPIRAIGDAVVLPSSANWFQGQPYVSYRLTSGPQRGKVVYVAEQISPQVKAGQRVRAGQRIGVYAPHGTGVETGYGTGTPGQTLAKATSGYSEGQETPAGKQARAFLERLGAR